jgi:hypothetical protein
MFVEDAAEEIEFALQPNSSIVDYLNPLVFDDPKTVAEISRRLCDGDLIMIKDAFIPSFAEYVWKNLSSDNFACRSSKFGMIRRTISMCLTTTGTCSRKAMFLRNI